jgi:hypothetical protein
VTGGKNFSAAWEGPSKFRTQSFLCPHSVCRFVRRVDVMGLTCLRPLKCCRTNRMRASSESSKLLFSSRNPAANSDSGWESSECDGTLISRFASAAKCVSEFLKHCRVSTQLEGDRPARSTLHALHLVRNKHWVNRIAGIKLRLRPKVHPQLVQPGSPHVTDVTVWVLRSTIRLRP